MISNETCAEAVFQLTEAIAAYEKFAQPNPAWHRAAVVLSQALEQRNADSLSKKGVADGNVRG